MNTTTVSRLVGACVFACAVLLSPAFAAGGTVQIPGMGPIQAFDVSNVPSKTSMATGRRQYQPLLIRKRIDASSPLLLRAFQAKTGFSKVVVTTNGIHVTLQEVLISSLAKAPDGTESVSLNFTKISWD